MPDTKTPIVFKASDLQGFEFPSYLNSFTAEQLLTASISLSTVEEATWLTERKNKNEDISKFIEKIGRNVVGSITIDAETQDLIIPIGTFMTSKGKVLTDPLEVAAALPKEAKSVAKEMQAFLAAQTETEIGLPKSVRILHAEARQVNIGTKAEPKLVDEYRHSDYVEYSAATYKAQINESAKTEYINGIIDNSPLKPNRKPMLDIDFGLIMS